MKYLLCFLLPIALLNCQNLPDGERDPSETTRGPYDDEDLTFYTPLQCRLQVRSNHRIRTGPGTGNQICGSRVLRPYRRGNTRTEVSVLGSYGSGNSAWIKYSSSETRSCPGGYAYTHIGAFTRSSVERMNNNECGLASRDIRRNPPPDPPQTMPGQTGYVPSRNGYNYSFPLPRCMGLKNRGGRGHYGAPRRNSSTGRRYPHTGVDYYCPEGTAVRSPCSGRVYASGYSGRAGRMLKIRCNDGNEFWMMHLHSTPRMRRVGSVQEGNVVGGCGRAGNARRQAPQLHLEFHRGRPRNRRDPQTIWDCRWDSGR